MAKHNQQAAIAAAALYQELTVNRKYLLQAMENLPGETLAPIAQKGDQQLLAAADVLFDIGRRDLLVRAVNSPALADEGRKLLASYLYGTHTVSPTLAKLLTATAS